MCKLFLFGRIIFVFSLIPFLFCSTSEASQDSDSSSVASFSSDSEEEKIEDFTVLKELMSSPQQLPINSCCFGIQVFVINVDQGNFICVKNCHTKKIVIVDAGSSNSNFMKILEAYRLSLIHIFEGCTIAAVIITHLDKDHYSFLKQDAFQKICNIQGLKKFVTICGLSQESHFSEIKTFSEVTYGVIPCGDSYKIISGGYAPLEDGITSIEKQINGAFGYSNAFKFCLPMQKFTDRPTKNDCSLVVRLSCEGGNILFTGDATKATFKALEGDPNIETFRSINFFVIPHHGADTAGSEEWLPSIVTYAKHNFVGAVVSANPIHTSHAHPRAVSVKKIFGKSAQKYVKIPFFSHYDKQSGVYSTRTHCCIYNPALLPGNIFWIKLENGLSIFDNEAFFKRGKPHESISPFFTPFTTFWDRQWVSVYSGIKRLKKLAKSDHELTVHDARNLNLHLQKMLSAHTAPMIVTNQYWMDLRDYYERVITKTPSKEVNSELLKDLLLRSPLPLGESSKKKQAVSYEDRSKSQPPLLSTVLLPVDGTPPVPPSGPDTAETAIMKREEEESQRSEKNLEEIIGPQITEANHHIQDVHPDGNCGFYAILQCLHLDKNYEHVSQGNENWNAAESLRREIFSTNPNLSQMVTNWPDPLQVNRFLPLDFEVLSTIARAQECPIIVINSTYVDNPAFEDPTAENMNYMFITVRPEGSIETSSTIKFKDVLISAGKNPIVLLYTPNHWKAVISNPSTKSSDKSSD